MRTKSVDIKDLIKNLDKIRDIQSQTLYDEFGLNDDDQPDTAFPGTFKEKCLELGEWGQRLLREFNIEENLKRGIDLDTLTYGSNKKVSFTCEVCGYTWDTMPYYRLKDEKHGCKRCNSSRLKRGENDAYTWCMNHGEFGQQLIKEFNSEKNIFTLQDVTYSSHMKAVWTCENGHTFEMSLNQRTNKGDGCPNCKLRGRSFPERFIYNSLKSIISDTEHNYRFPTNIEEVGGYELDIRIPSYKLAIEYNGFIHHSEPINGEYAKESKEYKKTEACSNMGYRLIHIHDKNKNIEPYILNDIIYFNYDTKNTSINALEKVVNIILKEMDINQGIDFEGIRNKTIREENTIAYEDSLEFNYADLSKQWDFEKNKDYTPATISYKSRYKAYWIGICGHSWQAEVHHRAENNAGCPYCSSNKLLAGFNDLQTIYPELAKEWHPTLNEKSANEVMAKSYKKFFWECPCCHYGKDGEWVVAPANRTLKGRETACPRCGHFWKTGKHKNSKCTTKKAKGEIYRPGSCSF